MASKKSKKNKKRSKEDVAPEATEARGKQAANNKEVSLLQYARVPIASVVGGFIIAALLSLSVVALSINAEHGRKLAEQQATSLQFQLNQRESQLLAQMQGAATSIQLTQVVTSEDDATRNIEETRLRELIPYAIRVRLIPLGTATVDRSATPPFSFTSKDLVNRVERGEAVHAEAIDTGTRWVLSVAAPIRTPSEETIRGTLFVYLDMRALSNGIESIADGRVTLLQSFSNNEPSRILTLGNATEDTSEYTRGLSNPNWRMQYQPSLAIANASVGGIIETLLPSLVFLVLGLGGIVVGFRQIVARINEDAAHLANQMMEIVADEFEHSTDYQFPAFVDLDFNLIRIAKPKEKAEVKKLDVKLQPKQTPANEMVDIEMLDQDEYDAAMSPGEVEVEEDDDTGSEFDEAVRQIFRAYDIRGIVGETLTPAVIKRIGQAIGTEAQDVGESTLVVGYDGRVSSVSVTEALIAGLNAAGCDVINIGEIPTPVLYFATHNSETRSGVMVTASHNPPDYNGFKIVIDGRTLVEEDIQRIYDKFTTGDFSTGKGSSTEIDISQDYIDAISDDVVVAQPLRVVVDCGNGVAGKIAPELFDALGCDVVSLYCDVDGEFPNHPPDTSDPRNLADLIQMVKAEEADLGIAIDGDGDRLVAITASGKIVWPDRLMLLFAKDVVSRNPGSDVVYDVKCTRHLNTIISNYGGRPVICRSGHSFVKAKIQETGAILGGEMSGHICFSERWFGFDDGLYSSARLLEIVGSQAEGLEELLDEFPPSVATPEILIKVPEAEKFGLVEKFKNTANLGEGTVTTIDGIRVDYSHGWGLVRASNTGASITLRFEADDATSLGEIQTLFREQLVAVDKRLDFTP